MSTPALNPASVQPRRQAAKIAIDVPIKVVDITKTIGPIKLVRAPTSSRENRSLPSSSNPSGWPGIGPT